VTGRIHSQPLHVVKDTKSTEKYGFVTATKLGTTNKVFVTATKNFAAAT